MAVMKPATVLTRYRNRSHGGWVARLRLACLAGLLCQPLAAAADIYQESGAAEVKTFLGSDQRVLAYRAYAANAAVKSKPALIYLHGIESHGGWFDRAALQLRDLGYDIYALDRRGSGLNRKNRDFVAGHAEDYDILLADILSFIDQAKLAEPPVLIGLSWGGKLATALGLLHPQQVQGLVLITPGLVSRVDADLLTKLGIFAASWLAPQTQYKLPITDEMFTVTPRYLDYIKNDPLRNQTASAAFLMASHRLEKLIDARIAENRLPMLLFLAGNDRIIDNDAVEALLSRGGPKSLLTHRYQDQTHSIQFDATERMVDDIHTWLRQLPGVRQ